MNFNPGAILKKERTLKLSNYFELVKPNYRYLKITTHKSIGEYNSVAIAKTIAHTYKSIEKRIRRERKKIFFETEFKISFMVDIQSNNADFYFIVPKAFEKLLEDKIKSVWPRATVKLLEEEIKPFSENPEIYQLVYKREDALSLHTDQRTSEPLRSILSVLDIMKDDDRISILYNFLPCSQFGWQTQYDRTMRKIDDNKLVDKKQTTPEYMVKSTVVTIAKFLSDFLKVIDDFTGGGKERAGDSLYANIAGLLEERKQRKQETLDKKKLEVINTQIAVISNSKDTARRTDNAISACNAFSVMEGDNELRYKRTNIKKLFLEDISPRLEINTTSVNEVAEFLQIPGRNILTEFKKIKYINNLETEVPDELKEGVMSIGTNIYRGNRQKAYLSTDFDYRNLTLCIIGPTRAGKSNLICHLSEDAIKANETVILFDFCGHCDMSDAVALHIAKDRVLNIACNDFDKLQGMGYNEISPKNDNMFELYNCTKMKAQQLVTFINAINVDTKLEPQMARYLKAAAYVVFISNGSIKDVFLVIENHVKRHEYIDKIPKNQRENLEEYIDYLNELDKWSNGTKDNPPDIIGTQSSKIQGILNRIDAIKDNAYTEMMLKKDCTDNIDLTKEMQKPQLICLRMPEIMFMSDDQRDIYCTYWLTKILGALQIRYVDIPEVNRTKVNIIFDELYQIPNCQALLKKHINRIAKKTCKVIISCHSLEQIKYIRPELKNANTSYLLISGCNKDNYNELKEELEPYELEDLLNLAPYHSLNLVKCNTGFSKFITALPPKYAKKKGNESKDDE